jgi:hypothetical protein
MIRSMIEAAEWAALGVVPLGVLWARFHSHFPFMPPFRHSRHAAENSRHFVKHAYCRHPTQMLFPPPHVPHQFEDRGIAKGFELYHAHDNSSHRLIDAALAPGAASPLRSRCGCRARYISFRRGGYCRTARLAGSTCSARLNRTPAPASRADILSCPASSWSQFQRRARYRRE